MDKPRIAQVLGVEVGEPFQIEGFKGEYHVNEDGVLKWGGQTSDDAIYEAINHPDRIIRKPRFTEEEVTAAKMFAAAYPQGVIERVGSDDLIFQSDPDRAWDEIPAKLFPSLRPGQSLMLSEITGETDAKEKP